MSHCNDSERKVFYVMRSVYIFITSDKSFYSTVYDAQSPIYDALM